MRENNLLTSCKITWCPGCSNFGILQATKEAILELEKRGTKRENIVFCAGIGCHGKILDYLNINSFYGLHGRAIPLAQGIKVANPDLKVICFVGDGDIYNEGLDHLLHAAKRNADITVVVHDNRNFALTVSQFTATSPKGFVGSSTPQGSTEEPFNPLALVFSANATFLARGYALKVEHLKNLMVEAVLHEGFSFLEVLQPCITFFDQRDFYEKSIYEIKIPKTKKEAWEKITEWNYENGKEMAKIPIGIFWKEKKPVFNSNE